MVFSATALVGEGGMLPISFEFTYFAVLFGAYTFRIDISSW